MPAERDLPARALQMQAAFSEPLGKSGMDLEDDEQIVTACHKAFGHP